MQWILSFSTQSMKALGATFPRLTDPQHADHGVQTLQTHSTQQAWQVHALQLEGSSCGIVRNTRYDDGSWLFLAVESYSRFTILTRHVLRPSYEEWLAAVRVQYWKSFARGLQGNTILHLPHQIKQVHEQFQQLPEPRTYHNYDQVLGGIANDVLQWLWAYLHDVAPPQFGEEQLQEFIENVNSFNRRMGKKAVKNERFIPYQRFIADCLYRFAEGLCPPNYPKGRAGNFPNPHHRAVQLTVVR